MRTFYLSAVLLIPACSHSKPISKEEALANLKADSQRLMTAIANNNVEEVADLTLPNLVRLAGGRKKYIEMLHRVQKDMAKDGAEIVSVDLSRLPNEWTESQGEYYLVIPSLIRMKGPDGVKLKVKAGTIAASADKGRTWRFVDANKEKGIEALKSVMPNFPEGLTLPKVTIPTIDED